MVVSVARVVALVVDAEARTVAQRSVLEKMTGLDPLAPRLSRWLDLDLDATTLRQELQSAAVAAVIDTQ